MFYIPKEDKTNKKFVNELLSPDKAIQEAMEKANLKKPDAELFKKNSDKLLTNDGREVLNEKK
jgi:hypothetical protein